MKRTLLITLLAFSFCALSAEEEKAGKIFVTGKAKDGKIYLRWASDNMFVLEQGLKHGFVVRRATIVVNGFVQDYPRTRELPGSPFMPKPIEQWQQHSEDDNFLIAAEALFGESFEVSFSQNPFMQAAQREQDRNQRLGFLLFVADQNFLVAEFSALGLVDANVQNNEKYLYSIFINDTSGLLHIDTGYYFIGPADVPDEPIMDDVLRARFTEHQVTLRWNIFFLKNYYSSYIIERSENGRDWISITERPFVLLENPGTDPNEMVFMDSLPHPNRTYHYRIRGMDAFGDLSAPSNVVQGRSQRALEANPELTELRIENERLRISWDFDRENEREVAHFEIRSREDRFGEDVVLSTRIAQRRRDIVIAKPRKTCYITVVAIGQDGTEKPSIPILFQEEDNTPPDPPVGVMATIDTNGVVHLHWRPNTEDDLSGYRVFRANQATAEFTQITFQELKDTVFFDTVSMNTTTSVFYRVMAVDFRGNQSQLSVVCEAKRPILFAPTAPVITDYRLDGQNLFLRWANSADAEVTSTQILIQTSGNNAGADVHVRADVPTGWDILATRPKTGTFDSTTLALQHSGNIKIATRSISPTHASELSNIIHLAPRAQNPTPPDLYVTPNQQQKTVALRWITRTAEPIANIQILRNELGEQPIVLRTLSGSEAQFTDTNLEEGKTYEYRIRIETEGDAVGFSRTISVRF